MKHCLTCKFEPDDWDNIRPDGHGDKDNLYGTCQIIPDFIPHIIYVNIKSWDAWDVFCNNPDSHYDNLIERCNLWEPKTKPYSRLL